MTLIEKIILFNTANDLHSQLQATQAMYSKQLQENPYDIQIQASMKRIDHDIQMIEPIAKQLGTEVYKGIETIFGKGEKFQFVPTSLEMFK
jgi:hypothetical protein